MTIEVRRLASADLATAGAILHEAFARETHARGYAPPWPSVREASELAGRYLEEEPGGALAAVAGGALAGVGFVRRRGEVATLGPLAASPAGQGVGSRLLDELVAVADAWECRALRLMQDAYNPASFALYASRSFGVVDVVACIERAPVAPPRIDASRGLEMAPFRAADLAELATFDHRLTGLERARDLEASTRLVARRRGAMAGYLAAHGGALGPAVALDVADLGALIARAVGSAGGPAVARLSTAAPTALLAALALGFRVISVGTVLSRGIAPPARPPQLYGLVPEIL